MWRTGIEKCQIQQNCVQIWLTKQILFSTQKQPSPMPVVEWGLLWSVCWHSNRIGNNLPCYFFNFLVLKIEQNLKLLSHYFSPTPHHRFSIQQIDHHSQGTPRVGGLLHGDKTTGLSSWRSSFGRLYEAYSQQSVWQNVSCQDKEIFNMILM